MTSNHDAPAASGAGGHPAPDWLLVAGDRLRTTPDALGYRRLRDVGSGGEIWVRGPATRLQVTAAGPRTMVVAGLLTDPEAVSLLSVADPGKALQAEPLTLVGHYAAVVVEGTRAWTVTDHLGAVPVAGGRTADGAALAVGTDVADVARLLDAEQPDPVSALEFVHLGSVTPPYTMYETLRAQGPSSVDAWDLTDRSTAGTYHWWHRRRVGPAPHLDEVAARLRDRVAAHLATLVARHPRTIVLVSAGEDSRTVADLALRAAPPEGSVSGVIFLSRRNREWRLASAVGRAMGLDIDLRLRRPDHYLAHIAEWQDLVGPGHDLWHAHSLGLIGPDDGDLVIDGYGADALLKGHYQPIVQRTLAGVRVGPERPAPPPTRAPLPSHPSSAAADARAEARHAHLHELLGSAVDDRSYAAVDRTWPLTRIRSYGYFISNFRARPTASPFLFGDVVDLVATLPEDAKLNRALYHPAFGRDLGRAGWVPRTGGEIPRLGGRTGRLVAATIRGGGEVAARLKLMRGHGGGGGPWQTPDELQPLLAEAATVVEPADLDRALALAVTDGPPGLDGLAALPVEAAYRTLQLAIWLAGSNRDGTDRSGSGT